MKISCPISINLFWVPFESYLIFLTINLSVLCANNLRLIELRCNICNHILSYSWFKLGQTKVIEAFIEDNPVHLIICNVIYLLTNMINSWKLKECYSCHSFTLMNDIRWIDNDRYIYKNIKNKNYRFLFIFYFNNNDIFA